ncbi:response regulator [Pseudoduganella ginsengisoli]|uniref:Response regulator n=1 Tax=Pseudoduganella ginsengisoli TaxID=1462440 RepID=A0A6L6PZV6_9BURK|nr:response regulator [Pseudoduganella ginsengisoli]MTW02538.1 response regulator [Pseudoduganella ginsengisoli]
MDLTLPIYQHPTLVTLIDDSQTFLESLSFQLPHQLARRAFHDAEAALAWVRDAHRTSSPFNITVGYDEEVLSFERRVVAFNVDQIYRMVMNRHRFQLPAVLVVDYGMPQMNGVAFCESVNALPCKKILFTGEADERVAIDAFNSGLIDRFIKKSDHGALDRLEYEVRTLEHAYFCAQSHTMRDLLARHSFTFLSDPAMATLVDQLRRQYGFVEYYLFPNPSGILFFDINGKPTLMVVETEAGMLAQMEVAQDNGAPRELVEGLQDMRLLPFFSDTGMYTDAIEQDWLSYCLPARHCAGKQDYYWALFDLPAHMLPGPVYSYADFLRDQGAVC